MSLFCFSHEGFFHPNFLLSPRFSLKMFLLSLFSLMGRECCDNKNVQKVAFLEGGGKNPRGIFLKHVQKVVFWKIYENVPFVAFHGGTERFNGKNSRFLREKGELMERIPLLLGKTPFLCHNMKAKSLSMAFYGKGLLGRLC